MVNVLPSNEATEQSLTVLRSSLGGGRFGDGVPRSGRGRISAGGVVGDRRRSADGEAQDSRL